jgi:hypothetical protein
MKNLARLSLYFCTCFIICFLLGTAYWMLKAWTELARTLQAGAPATVSEFIQAARAALVLTLYLTILLSLSYSSRRKCPAPLAILWITLLSALFTYGGSLLIDQVANLSPPPFARPVLVRTEGLVLLQGDTTIVLLDVPSNERGPRIAVLPDRPMLYQETPPSPGGVPVELPKIPFRTESASSLSGVFYDVTQTAGELAERREQGLLPYAAYIVTLILLLASLRFIMDLGSWPLANLFMGALLFRGILAFQVFIDSAKTHTHIAAFLRPWVSDDLVTPVLLGGLALLILLYSLLIQLAKGHDNG